jgi:hypothetical protein
MIWEDLNINGFYDKVFSYLQTESLKPFFNLIQILIDYLFDQSIFIFYIQGVRFFPSFFQTGYT